VSVVEILWVARAGMWDACPGMGRMAAVIFGCIVLTRPSSISGNPVTSETSRTLNPAPRSAFAVPPVEISSIPRLLSSRAKSTIPVLSVTLNRARSILVIQPKLTRCLGDHLKQLARLALAFDGVIAGAPDLGKEAIELRLQGKKLVVAVGREKPAVDGELVLGAELKLSGESSFLLEPGAGSHGCFIGLLQVLLGAASRLLAAVEQTETAFVHVQAIIRLMPDQHDAGTIRDMAVIGDVNEQLPAKMLLNPAVNDRYRVPEIDSSGLAGEDFDSDVLNRILPVTRTPARAAPSCGRSSYAPPR